jgi:hypothetical protein
LALNLNINFNKGSIMKNLALKFFPAAAIFLSVSIHANEATLKESTPVRSVLSKEETHKGVENGSFCSDIKSLAYSRGAVIEQNGKFYRCVKVYGENVSENKELAWVEVTIKNGVTEPAN